MRFLIYAKSFSRLISILCFLYASVSKAYNLEALRRKMDISSRTRQVQACSQSERGTYYFKRNAHHACLIFARLSVHACSLRPYLISSPSNCLGLHQRRRRSSPAMTNPARGQQPLPCDRRRRWPQWLLWCSAQQISLQSSVHIFHILFSILDSREILLHIPSSYVEPNLMLIIKPENWKDK
jgi:hypothetical protein